MKNYLFNNGYYPLNNRYYRFILINFKETNNHHNFLNTLSDALDAKDSFVIDDDYLLFYFDQDQDVIKEMFLSLSIDYGIIAKAFDSGKIDSRRVEDFHGLYDFYRDFLAKKTYAFANVNDLILEVIKTDIKKIKNLRRPVLKDICDNSQIEKLILSFLRNNLNVTKTAKEVYMHRNTVINKLEYIKNATGLNIQNFHDALCMYWLITIK